MSGALAVFSIGVVLLLITGLYCVVVTKNLVRAVIGLVLMTKSVTLLLIIAGDIGGLIAFGVIGLFIGPVLLAVTYNLLKVWVLRVNPEPEPEQAQPGQSGAVPLPQLPRGMCRPSTPWGQRSDAIHWWRS